MAARQSGPCLHVRDVLKKARRKKSCRYLGVGAARVRRVECQRVSSAAIHVAAEASVSFQFWVMSDVRGGDTRARCPSAQK